MIHGLVVFIFYYLLVGFGITSVCHIILMVDELVVRYRRNYKITLSDILQSYNHFLVEPENIIKYCIVLTVCYPLAIPLIIKYIEDIKFSQREHELRMETTRNDK